MVELSFFKYRGFWWENGGRVAGLVDSLRIRLVNAGHTSGRVAGN